jgi:uncharacterized protein YbjT (DUF2867 family)
VTTRILVTGGTGTLGRIVVDHVLTAGADVRVLSRGRRPHHPDVEHVTGDVRSGDGLDAAVAGVDTIVACVDPIQQLVDAAKRAGSPHLVYISIVGIDRVPFPYYRHKLADEQLIAASGLPWTVLRATQFHDLIAVIMRMLAKRPTGRCPRGRPAIRPPRPRQTRRTSARFRGPGGPNHGRSRAQLPQDGRQAAPDHAGVVARQGFSRLPRRRAPGT